MSMQDLRGLLALVEESGELIRIAAEVDSDQEIAEITRRVCKSPQNSALLFEKVKGYSLPVLTNLFGSLRRVGWALWTDDLETLAKRMKRDLERFPGTSAAEALPQLIETPAYLPRLVKQAPCQEVVEEANADLLRLPALKSWPLDGGRYLTLPMVFTREPATGRLNCGMYRVQIFDGKTVGIQWSDHSDAARHYRAWQARGKGMPVAIAIGGDPVLTYAAGAALPAGIDEVGFAGYIRRVPLAMTRCLCSDLEVPASAEIVLEGFVRGDRRLEGPFGNHTGFYVEPASAPVVQITAITYRRNPIYVCTVVGQPPMEDCFLAKATERLFLPLLQHDFPTIQDINFPLEGVFHRCVLVSLTADAQGEGKALIEQLHQSDFLKSARMIVVFNGDVDVQDPSVAYWHAVNRVQADRDVFVRGSQLAIDASRDTGRSAVVFDREMVDRVTRRWEEYGIKL